MPAIDISNTDAVAIDTACMCHRQGGGSNHGGNEWQGAIIGLTI